MSDTVRRFNGIVTELSISGFDEGPLTKKYFVAKDLFDVIGHITGAGNPDWQRTHPAAQATAPAISLLLGAGASLIGKSCTDELAYSIDGINMHYGAPVNPQYPDRVAGGSSSGSASAVATALVDFALGTDTGGSVRVPASYCGIYGFRPTNGRVPIEGVIPLAPSFDTVGWFSRSAPLLKTCGSVLLNEALTDAATRKVLVAQNAFSIVHENFKAPMNKFLAKLVDCFSEVQNVNLQSLDWESFPEHFGTMQAWEAWRSHGEWIIGTNPVMDQTIRSRFMFGQNISQKQYIESREFRSRIVDSFDKLLSNDTVLCIPTTCSLPPLVQSSADALAENRTKNMQLTSIAGLAGIPQVSIPLKISASSATGISFLAARGKDSLLLNLCQLPLFDP